jgi:methylmalonyl-CoA mutase C-terminal domain/subunit
MAHIRSVLKLLKRKKAEDIFVFAGGIIPEKDVFKLKGMGVLEIFTPGAATSEIVDFVQKVIGKGTK